MVVIPMMVIVPPTVVPSRPVPPAIPRVIPRRIPRVAKSETYPETERRQHPGIPGVGVVTHRQDVYRRVETVQPLSVYAVVIHHQHFLNGFFVGSSSTGNGIGFVLEALCLGAQVAYFGLRLFALGNGEAVVYSVKIIVHRAMGTRTDAASRECYGHYGRKNQLFHDSLLYICNVYGEQNVRRTHTNV